jgi:hypothetical protein
MGGVDIMPKRGKKVKLALYHGWYVDGFGERVRLEGGHEDVEGAVCELRGMERKGVVMKDSWVELEEEFRGKKGIKA